MAKVLKQDQDRSGAGSGERGRGPGSGQGPGGTKLDAARVGGRGKTFLGRRWGGAGSWEIGWVSKGSEAFVLH